MMQKNLEKRPPVVVVLGHVDHGKTSLLSAIRKSVMPKEPGKITQSIGAYEIDHNGKKLTFIDTPGHEAFFKMRSRGAKVADLAVLVVAADDGVQEQTKEVIKTVTGAKLPFVVAINKIDKEGVDINKVKNELTSEGVLLEGYGGSISCQPLSAKTGEGVNELLDLILLAADLEDLSFDSSAPGKGIILEAKMDNRKGINVSGIIKDGVMKVGEHIATASAKGKIKGLENFLGKRIAEAIPSAPVLVLGFESLPLVGEEFVVGVEAEALAKTNTAQVKKIVAPRSVSQKEGDLAVNIILKADVAGSLEALSEVIKSLPETQVKLKIIEQSVGEITDGDVQLALTTGATIIGFKISATKAAENLARTHKIKIFISEVIYELLKALEQEFLALNKTIIKGDLEILAIFGKKGATEQIVGGKVIQGQILNNTEVEIKRRDKVLGIGKLINVQKDKKDVSALEAGSEGGLLINSEVLIKEGDHLILR